MNYYNDNDPDAVEWLRFLIEAKAIPEGVIDQRSIEEVTPNELREFKQCHFFAGIGGWPLALRLAGWPDDKPVWTGSCPCQPFSIANQVGAFGLEDERHLLPIFAKLIRECAVECVFGEQVVNSIREGWLDELHNSLPEYRIGTVVLSAALVKANHLRERLYFVADSRSKRRQRHQQIERIPFSARTSLSVSCNNFSDGRRLMAGDHSFVLLSDGLSVSLERSALKGYGNAIVPPLAQAFIEAAIEELEL